MFCCKKVLKQDALEKNNSEFIDMFLSNHKYTTWSAIYFQMALFMDCIMTIDLHM